MKMTFITRNKLLLLILFLTGLFISAFIIFPYRQELKVVKSEEIENNSISTEYFSSHSALIQEKLASLRTQIPSDAVIGDVVISNQKYLFRRDHIVVMIPYIQSNIIDVGTAGTAMWSFHLGSLSAGINQHVSEAKWSIPINDLTFNIISDENTSLIYPGQPLSNELTIPLTDDQFSADGYSFTIGACTTDSSYAANNNSIVTVMWSGELLGKSRSRTEYFEIKQDDCYLNNVK